MKISAQSNAVVWVIVRVSNERVVGVPVYLQIIDHRIYKCL